MSVNFLRVCCCVGVDSVTCACLKLTKTRFHFLIQYTNPALTSQILF